MKRHIKALVGIAAVVGLATSVQAVISSTDGYTTNNWQGTPNYFTYNGTGSSSAINRNPGGAFVGEGNAGSGGAGFGGLAQTFSLTKEGMLNSIQIVLSGGVTSYKITLYNLGSSGSYVPASNSTFDPNSVPVVLTYSGLSYTAPDAGRQSVTKIDFTGSDQRWLSSGQTYAFAIEETSGDTLFLARGGADSFPGGQLYRLNQFTAAPGQYGAINGSASPFRHAAIAITVPEPTTVALLGIGALVSTFVFRRKV